jgi:hypothetical protein
LSYGGLEPAGHLEDSDVHTTPGSGGGIPPASELALLLAEMGDVPAKLIAAHTRDERGYCRGCALPQAGAGIWPCTLHTAATVAQRIDRQRRMPGR